MYDYTQAGFDAFLSRSIDNLPQSNLDSTGPSTTQIRYDSAQQSGSGGDSVRYGSTGIDATGVRVARRGVNIATAQDDDIIFDSAQNAFKIVRAYTGKYTVTTADATATYANLSFPHGINPEKYHLLASVNVSLLDMPNKFTPLPYTRNDKTVSYYGGEYASMAIKVANIDDISVNIRMDIYDAFGLSLWANTPTILFRFYFIGETSPS